MVDNKKFLAVITARAGSKGIKDKNYKNFCQRPLFLWSVIAALECKDIDDVVVSSNCPEVKKLLDIYNGAYRQEVRYIQRPEDISGPKSKNEEALKHAFQQMKSEGYSKKDFIVNLQPTSPIRKKDLLSNCINKITKEESKSLLTVSSHTPFFLQKIDNRTKWHFNRKRRKMRQDIKDEEMYYHDDGNVYITNIGYLTKTNCRLDANPSLYINDKYSSVQIDNITDWEIARVIKGIIDVTEEYI